MGTDPWHSKVNIRVSVILCQILDTFQESPGATTTLQQRQDMARRTTLQPSWLFTIAVLFSALLPVDALYFYMDGAAPKCFIEELPKDTLVVGTLN